MSTSLLLTGVHTVQMRTGKEDSIMTCTMVEGRNNTTGEEFVDSLKQYCTTLQPLIDHQLYQLVCRLAYSPATTALF